MRLIAKKTPNKQKNPKQLKTKKPLIQQLIRKVFQLQVKGRVQDRLKVRTSKYPGGLP